MKTTDTVGEQSDASTLESWQPAISCQIHKDGVTALNGILQHIALQEISD